MRNRRARSIVKRAPSGVALTRRHFLTIGGGSALWLATGCRQNSSPNSPSAVSSPTVPSGLKSTTSTNTIVSPPGSSDRVLVLVQMLGGNDALNTLVPGDGRYRDARPLVHVGDDEMIELTGLDGYGLHPSLGPLAKYWNEKRLAIAAGTGFEAQTRSHFDSRDVWWRAGMNVGPAAGTSGWLARWMEAAAIDKPDEPLEAIALGVGPRALAGSAAASVSDPTSFVLAPPRGMSEAEFQEFLLSVSIPSSEGVPAEMALMGESPALTAVRGSLPAALSTKKILDDLFGDSSGDPHDNQLGVGLGIQLRTAAALISNRPGLRVVTVGIDGFDTHSDQLETQANLLGGMASSVDDFWESLTPKDQDRTLMMTTSEFGRRVVENGSAGTDHGRAGIQFLIGGSGRAAGSGSSSSVDAGGTASKYLIGRQLVGGLDLANLQDGDLSIKVPSQDLFAEALRWLGGPVEEVLGVDPPATSLLN